MAYITLENVVKRYRMGEVTITAVDNITFDINKGEFVIIVGPSGAGKTTVLNILGGMDACDGGTISVDGELVTPTGAAVVGALRTASALPERFAVRRVGMGAGKRAYDTPGILRAMLIEPLA